MKALIAVLLLLVSFGAAADYRLDVRDQLAEEHLIFESCTVGFNSHSPGVGEGSYLYVTCDDEGQPQNYWTPGIWSKPYAEIEEVGINFPGNGYIERLDCYLVFFRHDSECSTGELQIECGDMHIGSPYSVSKEGGK